MFKTKVMAYPGALNLQQKKLWKNQLLFLIGTVPLPVVTLVIVSLAGGHARVGIGRDMMKLPKIDAGERSLFSMMATHCARCQNLAVKILDGIEKMNCTILLITEGLTSRLGHFPCQMSRMIAIALAN